jgi:hypothetical protein
MKWVNVNELSSVLPTMGNILCSRNEYCLHILYSCFLVWAGTTEKVLYPMVKDTVWCEVSKEHPGIPHMPVVCHL